MLRKDGLGESLVMKVVEKAQENNLKIRATCPYAVNYIKHHQKELHDVL
ncbi:N-acetyltransferase [Lactococcus lactis]